MDPDHGTADIRGAEVTDSSRRKFIRRFAGASVLAGWGPMTACGPLGPRDGSASGGAASAGVRPELRDGRPVGDAGDVLDVTHYGADPSGESESAPAFQEALDDVADAGGTVYVPAGLYRVGSTLVWPRVAGTNTLRPILLRGENPSVIKGIPSSWSRGTSALRYEGGGSLFDLRGGEGEETNFSGGLSGLSLHGMGREGTRGIDAYNVRVAQFSNLVVRNFGTNVKIAGESFYSVWKDCLFSDAVNDGAQFDNDLNGSGFSRCRFAANGRHGVRVAGGGFPVWLDGCWMEANRGYGVSFHNTIEARITAGYLEGNEGGGIRFEGVPGPTYRSMVSLVHSYVRPAEGTSAISFGENPVAVRLMGNMIDSSQGADSVLSVDEEDRHSVVAIGTVPVGRGGEISLFSGDPSSLESVVTLADECARDDEHLGSPNTFCGEHDLRIFDMPVTFPSIDESGRPPPGRPGRVLFNSDQGNLNIDTGERWVLPDGTRAS